MSFILDALRKSEAARRRSEAPDLFAAMPQTAEPERARRAWPLWAADGDGSDTITVGPPNATGNAVVPPADTPPIVADATPPAAASTIPVARPAASAPTASAAVIAPRELPLPPPPPAAAPAIAPPAGDQAVSIADLDPATRKQLPPLKLSMHLWNETPSGRFVILDGQRLKEGDVLGELVVESITRDGAVLVWRGGRLKIALQ
jgi:general secretion pathway protein B